MLENKDENIIIPMMFCFDKNYCITAASAFYSLLQNTNKYTIVANNSRGGGDNILEIIKKNQK